MPANNTTNATPTTSGGDGCATISQILQESPKVSIFPASIGYNCLQDVPVDVEGDAYLKNPPEGYPNPPVDLLAGLDDIADKLSEGGFTSEYDVQNAITNLLKKAYDGHTYYNSDISQVFGFAKVDDSIKLADLVSLSSDGKALPKVYFYSDIVKAHRASNFTPSAVTMINNQSTNDYLTWLADQSYNGHDPDTRYNSLFFNQAGLSYSGAGTGYFAGSGIYEGDKTTIVHENGTKTIIHNIAGLNANFTGVDSGETFFEKFCTGPTPTPDTPASSSSSSVPKPTAYGYPYPVYKASDNAVSGYFLNDTGYQDVAVISAPTFQPKNDTEFQDVVSRFLADAVSAQKKYLVVDLRNNGGGSIQLGFDLFKQLFPSQDPYGASRVRATDTYNAMGEVVSAWADDLDLKNNQTALALATANITSPDFADFWYDTAGLEANGTRFPSWPARFGPTPLHGDNFTALTRFDLNDTRVWQGFSVTGYQNRSALAAAAAQPFAAANIVLLQDGTCASTCAIFAELMKTQGGVRQLAVGGRPATGPMVAVGGTKGAQVLSWDRVVNAAAAVLSIAPTDAATTSLLADAGVTALADVELALNRTAAGEDGVAGSINYRNALRRGDGSQMPLQFVPDYADCRVWYTAAMLLDPVAVWGVAVDAAWRNGSCVAGSTGHAADNGTVAGSAGGPAEATGAAAAGFVARAGVAVVVGLATVMAVL
ncbi:putative peptidase s41 family protein [Neofusicoccum parvum]|nr:putative peptidase s41 family protein [Neofusicoccum parvum]